MLGSLWEIVVSSEDRLLSRLGDTPLGDRCSPALMVAAAAREDNEGDRGDGGLARASLVLMEMRRGRSDSGSGEVIAACRVGSEFRSGDILEEFGESQSYGCVGPMTKRWSERSFNRWCW